MLANFDRPETSKHLYFNLNNSLHLANPMFSPTYKIAGLYAIFKDNVCYYVGQSKNIPSRLSQHLSGKYEYCDLIMVFFVCEEHFENFHSRSKDSQKLILENNEKYLIKILKPVENLLIDSDFEIEIDDLFYPFYEREKSGVKTTASACLHVGKHSITIADQWVHSVDELDKRLMNDFQRFEKEMGRDK